MNADFEELESLLLDWESGALDDQGIERLREILKNDPAARSRFVQLQLLTAALQQEADAGMTLPGGDEIPSDSTSLNSSRRQGRSWRFWLAGVVVALVCLLSVWYVAAPGTGGTNPPPPVAETNDPQPPAQQEEATAQGVAMVSRLVDVEWEAGQTPLEAGDALPPGRFAIQSGYAQIEFFCGATVVVEAPAELEIVSTTTAHVRRGKLRAHVPPAARGFSLEVDDLKVVDLGTEFGLSVSPEGANVQVFNGEVELQRPAREKRLLQTGQAITRMPGGDLQDASVTPERFVDIADLASRAERQRSARYTQWKEWVQQWQRDPRLIACYAFDRDGDWERRLACDNLPANSELDGAIVGAREVAGRWGVKRALEFKQPADRVRVQIPGEYTALTFACWVRIDSLDRWYNSLFLTDGYDKGEPHWQILDSGQLYFSVRPVERNEAGPKDYKALSPSFWTPSLNGRWTHLAVTCDLRTNTIVHYLNGQVQSRHAVPAEQLPPTMRIGTASIGNWAQPTLPDARFTIRNLNGSLDELVILAAALTPEEIKEMYEHGKP